MLPIPSDELKLVIEKNWSNGDSVKIRLESQRVVGQL